MKKLLITLLAALVACGAFAQDSFPDIPANHWAADAVARIADLGIIIGFPDGTFRGNESFTRYQSALVISRTLDVLNANLDAMHAMTEEDIASLRNALQELASDVASQGVRLSAVEAAVAGLSDDVSAAAAASAENAGAIAALSDDVVANSARIDDVEAALDEVPAGLDPVLRDLQNQIASLRVAADTAQAQAESAEALASGAADAAAAAAARADENAEAITSINSVLSLLNDDVTDLQNQVRSMADAPPALPEGLTDDVARNSSDIANIREFVILLRRDQVALRDRVAALEEGDAGQAAAIDDLSARVANLEDNSINISGTIELDYEVSRVLGNELDVDRAFGVNADRDIGNSFFSSGADDLNDDDEDDGDYETEEGEVAQDRQDIEQTTGDVGASADVNIGFSQTFDGAGSPRALDTFEGVISFNIEQLAAGAVALDDADADSEALYVFNLAEFTSTFTVGGDAGVLDITFGDDVDTTLTPWLYEHPGEGFDANLGEPPGLDFLNLGLQAGYAAADPGAADTYDRYIRGTASPELAENVALSGGVTYAERNTNAGDKDDVNGDNVDTSLLGIDGQIGVGPLTIEGEFVTDISTTPATDGDVLDVTATVDGSALPILDSLSVNYHDIGANYVGLYDDTDDLARELDQTGIDVAASLN
ncbi:MAG: S-layer homology domain-containing protein, partial [Trueperaceae bacterium]